LIPVFLEVSSSHSSRSSVRRILIIRLIFKYCITNETSLPVWPTDGCVSLAWPRASSGGRTLPCWLYTIR
jgi:hypothetical protein